MMPKHLPNTQNPFILCLLIIALAIQILNLEKMFKLMIYYENMINMSELAIHWFYHRSEPIMRFSEAPKRQMLYS